MLLTAVSCVVCSFQFFNSLLAWAKVHQPKPDEDSTRFLLRMLVDCALLWLLVGFHILLFGFLACRSWGWRLYGGGWKPPLLFGPRVTILDLVRKGSVTLLPLGTGEAQKEEEVATWTAMGANGGDSGNDLEAPLLRGEEPAAAEGKADGASWSSVLADEDCAICYAALNEDPPGCWEQVGGEQVLGVETDARGGAVETRVGIGPSQHKKVCRTVCGHYYHSGCLERWLGASGRARCPLCRRDLLKTKQDHPVVPAVCAPLRS